VPTGQRATGGPPSHYKIDLANPDLMIAVEVDGQSHSSRAGQERDRRKDEWLTGAGWLVLRFSNREVMADSAACARMVTSITSRSRRRTPTS